MQISFTARRTTLVVAIAMSLLLIRQPNASAIQVLANVCGEVNAGVTLGVNGTIYGVSAGCSTTSPGGYVFALTRDSSTRSYSFAHLYDFSTSSPNPFNPNGAVVLDQQGNIYGTTAQGGTNNDGTVFKLTPDGSFTVLHNFSGADGKSPQGRLALDQSGNLFGVTSDGGFQANGVIFVTNATGAFRTVHVFSGNDGNVPVAGPTLDATSGVLYGMTSDGPGSGGTLYSVKPGGPLTTLHKFEGGSADGFEPVGSVVLDGSGNVFGTTDSGGICNSGTIFEFALPTSTFSLLYSFGASSDCSASAPDGLAPEGDLAMDAAGNLYGTTFQGGPNGGGTVFKLTPGGALISLNNFSSSSAVSSPSNGVVIDKGGTILAGTIRSLNVGKGSVFALAP